MRLNLNRHLITFAFLATVFIRATHNSLLEFAKGSSNDFPVPPESISITSEFIRLVILTLLIWKLHGIESLKTVFSLKCLKMFWVALFYFFDQVMELEANRYVDSITFTIISQSKLLITAVMLHFISKKMKIQQWLLLTLITLSLMQYILSISSNDLSEKRQSDSSLFLGITLTIVKVICSCAVAVEAQRQLRNGSEPFLIQFSWITLVQLCFTFVYAFIRGGLSIFDNISALNWRIWLLIIFGYGTKAIASAYIIKMLDALKKNIAEVLALLLVVFWRIAFMSFSPSISSIISVICVACGIIAFVRHDAILNQMDKLREMSNTKDNVEKPL